MFSYILGDNHPHVLAMPVVILVIGMALTLYLGASRTRPSATGVSFLAHWWREALAASPMGASGLALTAVVSGGLVFLNTWDYPPYWLLLVGVVFVGASRAEQRNKLRDLGGPAGAATIFGAAMATSAALVYLPYFWTAQSQAGGFVPNLFNPSRIQQVLLMFGAFVPAIVGMAIWQWRIAGTAAKNVAGTAAIVLGMPAILLAVSAAAAGSTRVGRAFLTGVPLPEGASSHLPYVVERWTARPFAFLFFGLLLAVCVAIVWRSLFTVQGHGLVDASLFALVVASLGLLLVYLPEFVFLRDNFGTRMNTVFKFYYQAWLLMAIAAAFVVVSAFSPPRKRAPIATRILSAVTIAGAMAGLLFPIAGVYGKTAGFSSAQRTLDATAYVSAESPGELAAVRWVLANTEPGDIVLEGRGASYRANHNRISSLTGRATLLGWEGHESQWRGKDYAEMAGGRPEVLERIYVSARPDEIIRILDDWDIEYVYVGPAERLQYGITPRSEERIAEATDLVFDGDGARIYRRR